ncbi:phosphoesterase, MJ0936 family [Priestia endophytica DSM 13796]|uniref:Phosphoesterase n=1 Tax=Priestia endophytica DSM 13796 TaxID=1121089 RepID=A0A1I6BLV5_9BACI|nr:phosphoesterase, MJ0936 family [Priestia endophytica DSM 13796]
MYSLKKKIAVLSDIHGNNVTLEAVLLDISRRNIDAVVNLGDSLYGPLNPLKTFHLLMEHNIAHIMGNCDRIILEPSKAGAGSTIHYVKKTLTKEALDWLEHLPNSISIDDILFCHGIPSSDQVYLLEEMTEVGGVLKNSEEIMRALEEVEQNIIFCGHSHIPRTVYLPNGKLVINPGSVGLPAYEDDLPVPHKMESGSPYANYTIIEEISNQWIVEHINVFYDWEKAAHIAETNERPDWAHALKFGRV